MLLSDIMTRKSHRRRFSTSRRRYAFKKQYQQLKNLIVNLKKRDQKPVQREDQRHSEKHCSRNFSGNEDRLAVEK